MGPNHIIAATGQHLDNGGAGTTADTDYTVTVVAGETYKIHASNGKIYVGIADVTTDANVDLVVGAGHTLDYTVSAGTSLHYRTDTDAVEGWLSRVYRKG